MTLVRRRVADGALDEVEVPDSVVVPGVEAQVCGQTLLVSGQARHRRRVGGPQ
jgi:hypothetical protein